LRLLCALAAACRAQASAGGADERPEARRADTGLAGRLAPTSPDQALPT